MAIAAVVLAFALPPIGLILGIIARQLDTRAGVQPNVLATVAIFGGVAMLVLWVIVIVAFLVALATINQAWLPV